MGARTGARGVGGGGRCREKETQKRGEEEEEGRLSTVQTVEVLGKLVSLYPHETRRTILKGPAILLPKAGTYSHFEALSGIPR